MTNESVITTTARTGDAWLLMTIHPATCDSSGTNCERRGNKGFGGELIHETEYMICPCGEYKLYYTSGYFTTKVIKPDDPIPPPHDNDYNFLRDETGIPGFMCGNDDKENL